MPFDTFFSILESWAKWNRVAKDRPLYKDLTDEGVDEYEDRLFRST